MSTRIRPQQAMRHERYDTSPACPVEATLELVGGKFKGVILYHLLDGTRRFNELQRLVPDVTPRTLTKQLRELEADGLVRRKVYAQVPPKVEYSLTPPGRTLRAVVRELERWGRGYLERQAAG